MTCSAPGVLHLAAYNAGEGRIAKALKRTDSDNFWSLLDTKQIRQETKDYVPQYIAATIIANTPEEYGFRDLTYHEPFEYDEVMLYVPVDIEVIAQCAGTSADKIRELNPELRRWSTPPNLREYTFRLPVDTADAFIKNLSNIPDEKLFSYETYTVKKNETLKKIASKSGVRSTRYSPSIHSPASKDSRLERRSSSHRRANRLQTSMTR